MLKKGSSTGGFTLIELLVVVAIMAVLIAILLPALRTARERSISVMCMSKFKEIAIAYSIYKMEFNDKGPIGFSRGFSNQRPAGWSTADIDNPYPKWSGWFSKAMLDKYERPWWALGYYLYRRGTMVKEERASANPIACPKTDPTSGHATGYSMNAYLGYNTYLGEHVVAPGTTPMLMCGDSDFGFTYEVFPIKPGGIPSWMNPQDFFLSRASYAHDRGANYLFFDGRVVHQKVLKDEQAYMDLWTWYGE